MPTVKKPEVRVQQKGTANEIRTVSLRIELPEHVYDEYARQAESVNADVDLIMAARLNKLVNQVGDGIFFNLDDKKRLEKICGRGVYDAQGALQVLETLNKVSLKGPNGDPFDLAIELEPKLMYRLQTRAGAYRGKTLGQIITKEVVDGLKRFCGLLPA